MIVQPFVPRSGFPMQRLTARLTLFFVFALAASLSAGWQYLKFRDGHGIFYMLNREHGDICILAVFLLMLGIGLWVAWTEKVDR